MTRFLFDTAIFVYATGKEHQYRGPCRHILQLAQQRCLNGEASVELVQEFAHLAWRRLGDRDETIRRAQLVSAVCRLHDFKSGDLSLALALFRSHQRLGMRDAVHAATALNRKIGVILSPDRDFDGIPGLERIDPTNDEGIIRLVDGPHPPKK